MSGPKYIQHRVNRLADLAALPSGLGAEIDLRSDVHSPGTIHLAHDAWQLGDPLEPWLERWMDEVRGPLVLNSKEDGLEEAALALLARYRCDDFFFLDTTVPTMVRWSRRHLGRHLALRLSAFEPVAALAPWMALAASQRPRTIWLDAFDAQALPEAIAKQAANQFEVCLVSPDLQGDLALSRLADFIPLARWAKMVCTKNPTAWQQAQQQRVCST